MPKRLPLPLILLLPVLAAVLALVFWAYLRPEFMLSMANQLWACF